MFRDLQRQPTNRNIKVGRPQSQNSQIHASETGEISETCETYETHETCET